MRWASTVEQKNSYDLTLHNKHGTQQLLTELSPNITKYFHEQGQILPFPHAYLQTPVTNVTLTHSLQLQCQSKY